MTLYDIIEKYEDSLSVVQTNTQICHPKRGGRVLHFNSGELTSISKLRCDICKTETEMNEFLNEEIIKHFFT